MDPRDAIVEARLRLKKLAARMAAEVERLEAENERLGKELSRLEGEVRDWTAAGRPEAHEATAILDTLRGQKAETELALDNARRGQAEAEEEGRQVAKLKPELERAEVKRIARSALGPDIDERSAEQIALENVRHHLDQLEAEAELAGSVPASAREAEVAAKPFDPRAELEALKAARAQKATSPEPATPTPKPKRSM